jgi:protein-tyrosine phosphatase
MRICFVCLGNICRSPTAHGVMEKLVADAGLADRITLDSAGTGNWHVGELPDERSREHAQRRGYALTHRARQFVPSDFARFDLVLAMDRSNLANLERLAAAYRANSPKAPLPPIRLLRSFDPEAPAHAEVPDPYAGGRDDFERVLDICERACRGLLEHVRASR